MTGNQTALRPGLDLAAVALCAGATAAHDESLRFLEAHHAEQSGGGVPSSI